MEVVSAALVPANLRGDHWDVVAARASVVLDSSVFGDGSGMSSERETMRPAALLLDGTFVFACGGVCGRGGSRAGADARGNFGGRCLCACGAGVPGGSAAWEI